MSIHKSQEIAEELSRRIRCGLVTEKLPSEKETAEEFRVARMTAAKALNQLCAWNLARRIPGRGTFVIGNAKRRVGVRYGNTEFFRVLKELSAEKFPDLELEPSSDGKAEMLIAITTVPFAYEKLLLPFPEPLTQKLLAEGRLLPFAFDVHRSDGFLYGIPAFFSPLLLAWNRPLMRKIAPDADLFSLTAEQFRELCAKAHVQGFVGFAGDFARAFLHLAILSISPGKPNASELERALDFVLPLFDYCGTLEDFKFGKALFGVAARTRIAWLNTENVDYDLAPLPLFFRRPCRTIISESLCVCRHAEDPERLFELCEFTLSPEFQNRLGERHAGIPVDRGAALGGLRSSSRRDDLFFSDTHLIRSSGEKLSFPVLRELQLLYPELLERRIGGEDFKRRLLEVFHAAETERRRTRQVFDQLEHFMQGE